MAADTSKLRRIIEEIAAEESLREGALLSDERLAPLVTAIEGMPLFAAVRGKQLNTGRGSLGFSTDFLALAVLRRAQERGVTEDIRDLEEFLTQETRGGRIVMLISSVFVSVPITLSDGSSLVPLDALKSNTLVSYRRVAPLVGGHMLNVTAALVIRYSVQPTFVVPTLQRDDKGFSTALAQLEDVRRCLCFFGPSTPVHVTHFWEPDDDAFGLEGTSWAGPIVELIGHEHCHPMTGQELHEYRQLLKQFSALQEHDKRILRVAIDRINRALRRHWSVDAAIELGVALEAFFLSDEDQSELTYRLRLRCAWWLGETTAERKQLMEWAAVIYKCRSTAVHTGYLAEKLQEKWAKSYRGLETRKFIHDACATVLRAISLALQRGMPDWAALVIGEGLPSKPRT